LKARLAVAGLVLAASLAACSGRASSAADPYIAQAGDAEEREGLTAARDDIDAEMSAVAAEKDREIDRLKQENAELKARMAARKKR